MLKVFWYRSPIKSYDRSNEREGGARGFPKPSSGTKVYRNFEFWGADYFYKLEKKLLYLLEVVRNSEHFLSWRKKILKQFHKNQFLSGGLLGPPRVWPSVLFLSTACDHSSGILTGFCVVGGLPPPYTPRLRAVLPLREPRNWFRGQIMFKFEGKDDKSTNR